MRSNIIKSIVFYYVLKIYFRFSKLDINSRVLYLSELSKYLSTNHCGVFAAEWMEAEIKKIGNEITVHTSAVDDIHGSKVLLMVTQLFKYGGHSKLLINYIVKLHELNKRISLAVSRQDDAPIPDEILALKANGTISELLVIGANEPLEKIVQLREIISLHHLVFLFISQDDAVSCAALSFKHKPFTYYINHADHTFWLGTSVIDELIDFRSLGQEITRRKRGFDGLTKILPLTLNDKRAHNKKETRKKLNLHSDDIAVVIMSSAFKLIPDGEYNIFNIVKYVIGFNSKVKFLVIGMSQEQYEELSENSVPENVICFGVLEDFSEIISAGDFVLDTFPLNSYMALLECMRYDLVPILHWGPFSQNMSLTHDAYLEGLFFHAPTIGKYKEQLKEMLSMKNIDEHRKNLNIANHRTMEYSRLEFWNKVLFKKETAINKRSVASHYNLLKLSRELNHQSVLYYSYLGYSPFAMVNNSLFDKELISFRLFKLIRWFFY